MCGIAGVYSRSGAPIEAQVLARMCDRLVHRGPDDSGTHIIQSKSGSGPSVGLAHTRLSIIDLFTGKQPMSNEDNSLWLVYNGEIYNYQELRDELALKGHVFRTRSDTEVILHLYEEHGLDLFSGYPECSRLHCLMNANRCSCWAVIDSASSRSSTIVLGINWSLHLRWVRCSQVGA